MKQNEENEDFKDENIRKHQEQLLGINSGEADKSKKARGAFLSGAPGPAAPPPLIGPRERDQNELLINQRKLSS